MTPDLSTYEEFLLFFARPHTNLGGEKQEYFFISFLLIS